MKLIIDIPEEDRKDICNIHFVREDLKFKIGKSIMNGTPFDSVIEDIKAEIRKLHPVKRGDSDYANGVYDGECWVIDKAFFIIDKHIGKAESEE